MRVLPILALCASAVALAACGGAGGGAGGTLSDSGTLAAALDVCGIGCTVTKKNNSNGTTSTTTTPTTTAGTGTGTGTGTTTNTNTSTVNTGSTTSITNGDRAIVLQGSQIVSSLPNIAQATLQRPTNKLSAQVNIDPKNGQTDKLPVPKMMAEYLPGTCGTQGIDPTDTTKCLPGGGQALGGEYHEYRMLSTGGIDEELQVWNWGDTSYAWQYRDMTGGGADARNQAWSFGGKKTPTAALPTTGTVRYTGEYTGTSKSGGWLDPNMDTHANDPNSPYRNIQTVSRNGLFRMKGTTDMSIDYATNDFKGTLTPTQWIGWQTMNNATGEKLIIAGDTIGVNQDQNHAAWMDDKIDLRGSLTQTTVITPDPLKPSVTTTTTTRSSNVSGTATLDWTKGWVNSVNPMYAGVFGDNAEQVTGVFNLEATSVSPIGGDFAITNDKRAYVQQSGMFHGDCTVATCP